MRTIRLLSVGLLAIVAMLLQAGPAAATFHEMSIREVYPGSIAQPESEYVELQMWAPGQNLVGGHSLKTFGSTGTPTGTTTFASNVSGAANQSTILLATPAAESQFGVAPDTAMTPGQLNPVGGAVCWAETIDCVSWGSFSGSTPAPAGSSAAPGGIPDGMALRRTISPGCATLLEATDDRDNSAVDFAPVFPSPRPNSVAPSERPCGSGGGSSPGGEEPGQKENHSGAPQTTLRRKPPLKTHDRTPTFRFSSDEPGSTFQCKLDRQAFKPCRSPLTTKRLGFGHHTFKVRARDGSGRVDPSPASYSFRIVARAK